MSHSWADTASRLFSDIYSVASAAIVGGAPDDRPSKRARPATSSEGVQLEYASECVVPTSWIELPLVDVKVSEPIACWHVLSKCSSGTARLGEPFVTGLGWTVGVQP
eukprot:SAG31_NODE_7904_length_1569_cov_1.102721_2_plen_107_part_00